jgi:hypothetical protein
MASNLLSPPSSIQNFEQGLVLIGHFEKRAFLFLQKKQKQKTNTI